MNYKKINESINEYCAFKYYEFREQFNIKQLITALIMEGYDINYIEVEEETELDMHVVDGFYRLNDFLEKYEMISKYDISIINIFFEYYGEKVTISCKLNDKTLQMMSPNANLELDDLFKEKKNNMIRQ